MQMNRSFLDFFAKLNVKVVRSIQNFKCFLLVSQTNRKTLTIFIVVNFFAMKRVRKISFKNDENCQIEISSTSSFSEIWMYTGQVIIRYHHQKFRV